ASTAFALGGCHSSTTGVHPSDGGAGSSASGGSSGGGATGSGGSGYDGPAFGIDVPPGTLGNTQCSDGKDNDGDGLIDYADPSAWAPSTTTSPPSPPASPATTWTRASRTASSTATRAWATTVASGS